MCASADYSTGETNRSTAPTSPQNPLERVGRSRRYRVARRARPPRDEHLMRANVVIIGAPCARHVGRSFALQETQEAVVSREQVPQSSSPRHHPLLPRERHLG